MNMNKRSLLLIGAIGIIGLAILSYYLLKKNNPTVDNVSEVRIGWQTAWADQGQIIQSMAQTNIPSLYGLKPNFQAFLFGPDLNEAANTGAINCTNSGIVPTVNLLAANDDWVIVGRQVDFLVSIVARNSSGVERVSDLKGKSFGIPFAGGSHPYALQRLKVNGVSTEGPEAVRLINLKPSEQALAMQQGSVDAVAIWEPTTTQLIDAGNKVIDSQRYVGFITVRKSFAQQHPEQIVAMLKSYIEANYFVAMHHNDADAWFAKVSSMPIDLVKRIKTIEPNFTAKTIEEVKLGINENDVVFTQQVADIMQEAKLIPRPVKIAERIDMAYLDRALKELKESGYKTQQVKMNAE